MGGKALLILGIHVDRIPDVKTYNHVVIELKCMLSKYYQNVQELYQFPQKTSFGDIDLIVSDPIKEFNPEFKVKNGNIISFLYTYQNMKFQVDLISCTREKIPMNLFILYYDVSACLGLFFKRMGCLLNHNGLHVENILLTDKPEEICKFLGIHYFPEPFNLQDDQQFIDWILSSHFDFGSVISSVNLEKNKNIKRHRSSFILMVNSVKQISMNNKNKIEFPSVIQLIQYFGKTTEYERVLTIKKEQEEFKSKLNGDLVKEWTGKEGLVLGETMRNIMNSVSREEVLSKSSEEVKQMVMSLLS